MPLILHVENFATIALAGPQIGVAALQLNVDLLAAWLAIFVLEFNFAINTVVEHGQRPEDLICLARNGHHVADEDLLQRLIVEFPRGRRFHVQNFSSHRIAFEALLDEVD